MRNLAILLNIALIGLFLYFLVTKGLPKEGSESLIALLLFAAPTSTLWALLIDKDENWLSLYLRRKALEERKKIQSLSSDKHS
ncbi:hypothetical protein MELA_01482 [Candidatus Methylomirabilis lanthanidiphila]|uniref:Uncharacterized protein n=1 Tax=Candidatus Methylomirabilis lanthanidiphila TaxID=2211376 RepID=A0A564ZJ36_9BACT|nr:hypothetical protein MELA_01482 [Candidatus Methylomirabilis lanthanidiphila]